MGGWKWCGADLFWFQEEPCWQCLGFGEHVTLHGELRHHGYYTPDLIEHP